MFLSDLAVKRPVFAAVISFLLIAFGLVAFDRLPLREYPDIDPPIVSIETIYRGAAAAVVESRITQLIEDRISGVEGVRTISSTSEDGRSNITLEFNLSRDIDAAANDVRDRVAGLLDDLPDEADPPEIQKVDASAFPIMWINLVSDQMSILELTDYAKRFISDRFAVIDGVARARVSGGFDYAMRIWLDRNALAARGLTVDDVESALRAENVELPAGSLRSRERDFTLRIERGYKTPQDFEELILAQGDDGYLVRLRDVARVELGAEEARRMFRGNGVPMVGIGIIKQSTANTLAVSQGVKAERDRVRATLPAGIELKDSFDSSVFIESAIGEVYRTLFIAAGLVVLVIFLFLGDVRATLVPAVTLPVSVIATFIVLYFLGYSLNLLTLLALVLAIGLVVDDGIVVLENIHRRLSEGEPPRVATYRGARQVGFAVIVTTLVLVAVFVPITFLEGNVGRLFAEFAIAMAAAVGFSSLVALTLSPVLCMTLLRRQEQESRLARLIQGRIFALQQGYRRLLAFTLRRPKLMGFALIAVVGAIAVLFMNIPSEFAPKEDRGVFFMFITGPEGSSYERTVRYVDEIERRLMPLVESGEIKRLLLRAPSAFGLSATFNRASAIIVLEDWNTGRRSGWEIMKDVQGRIADLSGVQAYPIMPQALGGAWNKPVQFVLGGSTYEELAHWRDILIDKASANPKLLALDYDYKETKPQMRVRIDRDRAGDLGVSIANVSRTLETFMGSRVVTTFMHRGEEYDVILEGEVEDQRTRGDLENLYVRSERTGDLIPLSSLVSLHEVADSPSLNRYNRMRAITIEAGLADGYSLGEALAYLENLTLTQLPPGVKIDYKGQSLDYKRSSGSIYFTFLLALLVVFLVLAAQFESFVHPGIIMLTVPLAVAGALLGLFLTHQTFNIYSQIGIIMLVGLAAKNGILIVEFANQLRDEGKEFTEALIEASTLRLRPILMTALTTIMGGVPLLLASGAGSEARIVIGVVVVFGVALATVFTLFVVPAAYQLFARNTGSPLAATHALERELALSSDT